MRDTFGIPQRLLAAGPLFNLEGPTALFPYGVGIVLPFYSGPRISSYKLLVECPPNAIAQTADVQFSGDGASAPLSITSAVSTATDGAMLLSLAIDVDYPYPLSTTSGRDCGIVWAGYRALTAGAGVGYTAITGAGAINNVSGLVLRIGNISAAIIVGKVTVYQVALGGAEVVRH